jgi:hypothetical protein
MDQPPKGVPMKTTISTNTDTQTQVSGEWNSENSSEMVLRAYHEMADQPVVETDVLSDFRANLQLLEELQSRMSFVMKEVRYVLKLNV